MNRVVLDGIPDLLTLHEVDPSRYPFLLQSVAGHPVSGRYDLLFAHPQWASAETLDGGPDFFGRLSVLADAVKLPEQDDVPFIGGWFLFLSYEAAGLIEAGLRLPAPPQPMPQALAVRCPAAVVVDREQRTTILMTETGSPPEWLVQMRADVERALAASATAINARTLVTELVEEPAERFLGGVARVLEYLKAGDSFQINLSRRWQGVLKPGVTAAQVFRQLKASNPAPFAGLARLPGVTVLSSSPERLIALRDGWADTRPIAGTRPRGGNVGEDADLKRELTGSLKERAEHVMLIDLERNDLGRVCVPGSVAVSELMTVESYAHVHHIVSNVRGRLRPGVGVGEAIAAVFPGGTITGCPKLRSMEIIAELEGEGRGAYTGAMGYLGRDGRLDLNILIRTLLMDANSVSFRAGAGIVADSDPALELAETRAKARGLIRALLPEDSAPR